MTASPPPHFHKSDERDELGYRLITLRRAAEILSIIRNDPDVSDYRLGVVGDCKPLLPAQDEFEAARRTIEHTLACLRHSYSRRCRPNDNSARNGPAVDFEDEGEPW